MDKQDEAQKVEPVESDDIASSAPTRRSFVAGGIAAVGLIAIGGAGAAWGQGNDVLRPPGAQDETEFLAACIRCDRCRSACPQNAIGVSHLEDGFLNVRTPKMDFQKGACDFCNGAFLCVASCPTQAIVPGFDPQVDRIGTAVVDREECLLYRSTSHLCSKQCISACPYEAVVYDPEDNFLSVIPELCNGCGACEFACPSASYGAYTSSGKRGINVELA